MCKWIKESNRIKHLVGGAILSLFFTILCTLGCAGGMEFKDCHYSNGDKPFKEWNWNSWDWLDFSATMIGGLIGQVIQIIIILLIFV